MVKLVKDKENRIPVVVTALIDYSGFSATLDLPSTSKSIPALRKANLAVTFSAEEVEGIGEYAVGTLSVYNPDGELHMKSLVTFIPVETERDAVGFQQINVILVSLLKFEGSRRGGGGGGGSTTYATKAELLAEIKARLAGDKKSVEESKQYADEAIQEALDDSDESAALVVRINKVEEKVDDEIEPRLDAVEITLAEKVSVNYGTDESDEGLYFDDGENA